MKENIIPDFVILTNVVESNLNEVERQTLFANERLKRLKAEGIPTDLPTLKSIVRTEEAFEKWLNDAENSYIGKIGFLPKEEKERIHSTFLDLSRRTEPERNYLQGFIFGKHSGLIRQEKDGSLSVDMQEIRKDLEEKHRKTFTEKDKEYYSLVLDARKAYKAIQEFERIEKYAPFSMTDTCSLYLKNGFTPEAFAYSYEWGKMNDEYIKMIEDE